MLLEILFSVARFTHYYPTRILSALRASSQIKTLGGLDVPASSCMNGIISVCSQSRRMTTSSTAVSQGDDETFSSFMFADWAGRSGIGNL